MKISYIVLLVILCIGFGGITPVSAEITTVAQGEVVFVGEEGLTFRGSNSAPIVAGTVLKWYAPGDTPNVSVPSATYTTQGPGNEVIDPATFQTRTGTWYLSGTTTAVINVMMPAIDVRTYNSATAEDMTNQYAIKEGSYVTFRLDSNLYEGIISRPNYVVGDATGIKVIVSGPDSTTYTALYDDVTLSTSSLTNLVPTTVQYYLPGNSATPTALEPNWFLDRSDYPTGTYTFYAQVNLNSLKDNLGTVTGATKSEVKTLDIVPDFVNIEANRNTVIRSNDFSVTINGRPNEYYVLWVTGTSTIATPNTAPYIKPNQENIYLAGTSQGDNAGLYQFQAGQSVQNDVCQNNPASGEYFAMVRLSNTGSRTVGFGTDETANTQPYTIRTDYFTGNALAVPSVAVVANSPLYNTTQVIVKKGDVTITASGETTYSMGEEIVLSGINTDSDDTWLFITGPNLPIKGGSIVDPFIGVNTGGVLDIMAAWTGEGVMADDTWEFKWNTAGVNLDAGTYTIYAVNTPTNKNDLETNDAIYDSLTLTLAEPKLTVSMPRHSYLPGETIHINGTAAGAPTQGIAIWILGDNYRFMMTESISDTGSFAYEFTTSHMSEGQYTVFVQHPMGNDQFDIAVQSGNPAAGQTAVIRPVLDAAYYNPYTYNYPPRFIISGLGSLKYPVVADALEVELSAPAIDDIYVREEFIIGTPWIAVDPITDHNQGETIVISGSSNLPAGESITISGGLAGTGASPWYGNTEVIDGGGFNNTWAFSLDTTGFIAGTYNLSIVSTDIEAEENTQFTLLKQEPSTVSITHPVSQGWNLISVPVNNATIRSEGDLYPTAFLYNCNTGEYQSVSLSALSSGKGYWVGAYADTTVTFTGNALDELSMSASDGWNMLGTLSMETSTSSLQPDTGSIISVYAYNPEQRIYFAPGILTPGSGNWVDATEACTITLTTNPPVAPA